MKKEFELISLTDEDVVILLYQFYINDEVKFLSFVENVHYYKRSLLCDFICKYEDVENFIEDMHGYKNVYLMTALICFYRRQEFYESYLKMIKKRRG